jgi:hypothetical protein
MQHHGHDKVKAAEGTSSILKDIGDMPSGNMGCNMPEDGRKIVLPEVPAASQPSRIILRAAVEERYFGSAALKTARGVPQMPREEITREEALKRPCYYVGRYVAGLLIEAEKFDSQGRSQFVITYTYKGTKPSDSSMG